MSSVRAGCHSLFYPLCAQCPTPIRSPVYMLNRSINQSVRAVTCLTNLRVPHSFLKCDSLDSFQAPGTSFPSPLSLKGQVQRPPPRGLPGATNRKGVHLSLSGMSSSAWGESCTSPLGSRGTLSGEEGLLDIFIFLLSHPRGSLSPVALDTTHMQGAYRAATLRGGKMPEK